MTPAAHAQLALLLEVAGTPKPGNVDRCREYPDLRFEHFLAGAVGARAGLRTAADVGGPGVGEAFSRAVAGMGEQSGGNTQFGALLLLAPLVRAGAGDELTPAGASAVAEATTVEDAAGFYRAFDHVDVGVPDPPDGWAPLDVRRGGDAVPELRRRDLTLHDVMGASADRDGVAREWTGGFERAFHAADLLAGGSGPVAERVAGAYLELLAAEPDTFVATQHDEETAREVVEFASEAMAGDRDPADLADDLVEAGINPGTTADLVAAGLFVALERGAVRV